jgi:hypothetical protein
MERETGIEPATNSLEGCDSTTELLPPTRLASFLLRRFGVAGPRLRSPQDHPASPGLPSRSSRRSRERRLVAREGLEPSKPLGRQIYSLLRLTASLPRQLVCVMETRAFGAFLFGAYPDAGVVGRWSWRRDLNPRPADYKSAALPD